MANPSYFTSAPVTQEIQQTELNFHLYMYQWVEGSAEVNEGISNGLCTERQVVNIAHPTGFGAIYANEWTMYDGPGPGANLVARAQGVHTGSDMNLGDSWLVCLNIVFVDQRFKGSTLKVVGNYGGLPVDEWAIVGGGTGEFGFAQGVGTFRKYKEMGNGNMREFNIRVRCPTLQPPAPTPPNNKGGPLGGKGGEAFDIPGHPQRLERVTIRSGDIIDSLAFSYTDQAGKKLTAGPWGGNGGLEETITFAPTETLKKVFGAIGNFGGHTVVTSLTLVTNVKIYPTFGKGTGGTTFSIPEKNGSVVGFFGRAGLYVDAIGAYIAN